MCVVGAVLLRLEKEDGAVPEIEVNEVFRLCDTEVWRVSRCPESFRPN